jgi:hypothetical protein
MFTVFRRLAPGLPNVLLSGLLVFAVLFFRPRSASLILPAQMTPSGGPVRFLWCFVLLVWLLHSYDQRSKNDKAAVPAGFPIVGHIIWLLSIAWSFEAAIYCTAIWFSAFAVYLIQQVSIERRRAMRTSAIVRRLVLSVLVPAGLAVALYGIVWIAYVTFRGGPPDLAGYIEYGFLYTRGYGALPIATTGAIWYLLLVFFVVSTIGAFLLIDDWRSFRLVVAAGVWGGVWSVSSYYVSRSHPVNLLSITPVLLFALAVLVIVIRDMPQRRWQSHIRIASVPLFAIPIAMTLGHPLLLRDLATPQLTPARFTDQIPLMDAELQSLLRESGATPRDPVVRIVDGRLLLPAWLGSDGLHVMSPKSWLPKPYEIISTLPRERREAYIARDAEKPVAGWLIHHATDTLRGFDMNELFVTHQPQKTLSRGPWRLWWMVPKPRPDT